MAKMCMVSRLERKFATLYLFHAPTGICVNTGRFGNFALFPMFIAFLSFLSGQKRVHSANFGSVKVLKTVENKAFENSVSKY